MLLRYISSLARKQPTHKQVTTQRPRRRCQPLGLEELEGRCTPAHILLWIGAAGGALGGANYIDTTDQQLYAPANGDSLIFNPSMTVGTKTGTNTSPALGPPAFTSLQNLTLATPYTGTVIVNFDLTITGNLTLTGGTLTNYTDDQGHIFGSITINPPASSTSTFTVGTNLPGTNPTLNIYTDLGSSSVTMNVAGPATLSTSITNNGTVNFQNGGFTVVGPCFDNYGTVNLQGDDSFGTTGYAFYNEPNATFEKTGGSQTSVVADGFTNMGYFFLNSGIVSLTGSSWQYQKSGSSFIPQTELNGGGLKVSNPYLMLAGWLDGVGSVTGTVNAGDPTGYYTGAGWVHPGFLGTDTKPGTGGRLNISGDFWEAASAEVVIELTNGWGSGAGQLGVGGTATLNGTIYVNRQDSFEETSGSMNIITYGAEAGNPTLQINNAVYSVNGTEYRVFGADKVDGQNAWTLWADLSD